MAYVATFFVFMTFLTMGIFLKGEEKPEKVDIIKRLSVLVEEEGITDIRKAELKDSFSTRVVKPFFSKIAGMLTYLLPASMLQNIEPKLSQAGNPGKLTSGEFLSIKIILATLFPIGAYFLLPLSPWYLLGFFAVGWHIPESYLKTFSRKRLAEIEKTLPDIIDLLTVSVEAGLSFDGAMAKVAEKSSGILGVEFRRVLQENKMGKNRKEAMKDMAKRLGEENITTLVGSIVQAEQLGISFSKVLRLQSEQVRYKRKQRVEEAAMKAPIKMLIPLVFFIFPTIFIVLLGPAAIRIFTTLMQ